MASNMSTSSHKKSNTSPETKIVTLNMQKTTPT